MTVGIDLFQMAFLSNFGAGVDDEAMSNPRANPRAKDPDGHWKNDCAEVIASDCGGDMTHCYAAFTETDVLLGGSGGGDAAHWKNDCAEVIASDCGGDMTHCYAAFTETDVLLGVSGGGDAAHWKSDCAEVIASDCGGGMTHCYAAFTDTEALLGKREGGDVAHWKNDCAEVIASDCGGDVTRCYAALTETDAVLRERGARDEAPSKNACSEVSTSACGVRDHAAFIETNGSIGKPVSSRMSDSPGNSASWSLSKPIEGPCDEWGLCFALLKTASVVVGHILCHDSGRILPEIISSCSAGDAEAVGSAKCLTALLHTTLEQFLERSALCLKHHMPTDCCASALSSHAESPGSVAALVSLP